MTYLKSIVTNATYLNRTFGTQNGTFYIHSVNFADGNHGEYNSKSEDQQKFVIGQEADYELIPTTNPNHANKIKPYNPLYADAQGPAQSFQQAPNVAQPQLTQQQAINKTVALKEAVTILPEGASIDLVIPYADAFNEWLEGLYIKDKMGVIPDPNNVDPDGIPF